CKRDPTARRDVDGAVNEFSFGSFVGPKEARPMTTPRHKVLVSPFPLLPLRNGVLFPGTIITLPVGRERSVALVRGLAKGDVLGVATQKDPAVEVPGAADLHPVGTHAKVAEILRLPTGDYRIALEAIGRFTLRGLIRTEPYWLAEGE